MNKVSREGQIDRWTLTCDGPIGLESWLLESRDKGSICKYLDPLLSIQFPCGVENPVTLSKALMPSERHHGAEKSIGKNNKSQNGLLARTIVLALLDRVLVMVFEM